MNCSTPMDAAVLADYWLASLADSEEEAVELHLLDCDQCGAQLRAVIALAAGVRKLAREGSLRVTAEDDMLIGRLAANLTGAERVDLCLCGSVASSSSGCGTSPFTPGQATLSTRGR